jgi:hypothetical protein
VCCAANQSDESVLDVSAHTAKAAAATAADNVKSFISGGFGGASAVLVGASPFTGRVHYKAECFFFAPFCDFQGTHLTWPRLGFKPLLLVLIRAPLMSYGKLLHAMVQSGVLAFCPAEGP